MRTGPSPPKIDQGERFGGAYRDHQPRFGFCFGKFPPPPACEAIASEGFPKRATHRFGCVQHGVMSQWIAEPARHRYRAQRGGTEVSMDHPEDSREENVSQPGAQMLPVVSAGHAKSPCLSPSTASATRSTSPLARSASGLSPSRDARSVVSQTQAA